MTFRVASRLQKRPIVHSDCPVQAMRVERGRWCSLRPDVYWMMTLYGSSVSAVSSGAAGISDFGLGVAADGTKFVCKQRARVPISTAATMFKKIAHNSTIPALAGNQELRPLQDLITAEKAVLTL